MIERAALPGAIFVDRAYAFAQHGAGRDDSSLRPFRRTAFGGLWKKRKEARG
jgi:hypothetical protein